MPSVRRHRDSTVAAPQAGSIYDEESFRYLLDVERGRARVADRTLLLVIVNLRRSVGFADERGLPSRLMEAVRASLRETDLTGWWRQSRIAAGVLIDVDRDGASGAVDAVAQRVSQALHAVDPSARSPFRIRVVRI
jgi:hypothetical protein